MIAHIIDHMKGTEPYKCPVCDEFYSTAFNLKEHMLSHPNVSPLQFQPCDVCCNHHPCTSYLNENKKQKSRYTCKYCSRIFFTPYRLSKHLHTHTLEQSYECDICKQKMSDRYSLRTHIRSHMPSYVSKCQICERCFSRTSYLKENKQNHPMSEAKYSFKCENCEKRFLTLRRFQTHIGSFTGPFECDFCKKRFAHRCNIKEHILAHMSGGNKPYVCEGCKKKFSRFSYLKRHMQNHPEAECPLNDEEDNTLKEIKFERVMTKCEDSLNFSVKNEPDDLSDVNCEVEFEAVKQEIKA